MKTFDNINITDMTKKLEFLISCNQLKPAQNIINIENNILIKTLKETKDDISVFGLSSFFSQFIEQLCDNYSHNERLMHISNLINYLIENGQNVKIKYLSNRYTSNEIVLDLYACTINGESVKIDNITLNFLIYPMYLCP